MTGLLPIPTWKDRLKACFQLRHRLLQVFGVPAVVGLFSASIDLSGAENYLALLLGGGLSAAALYLVTVGADRRLNDRLFEEKRELARGQVEAGYATLRTDVVDETRNSLQRIDALVREISTILDKGDGDRDALGSVLAPALDDIRELRAKAYQLAELDRRLALLIASFDLDRVYDEAVRHQRTIKKARNDAEQRAAEGALAAVERKKEQIDGARARLSQVRSALSTVESNLSEFKVGIELRRADLLMNQSDAGALEDLQARLAATGSACDEILGPLEDVAQPPGRRASSRVASMERPLE